MLKAAEQQVESGLLSAVANHDILLGFASISGCKSRSTCCQIGSL